MSADALKANVGVAAGQSAQLRRRPAAGPEGDTGASAGRPGRRTTAQPPHGVRATQAWGPQRTLVVAAPAVHRCLEPTFKQGHPKDAGVGPARGTGKRVTALFLLLRPA